jgi:hypothetical protein
MRKPILAMLLLAPLLAACGKAEEPLLPELKGKWAPPTTAQAILTDQMRAQKVSNTGTPPKEDKNFCRILSVNFTKQRINMSLLGFNVPVFNIRDVKREGNRIIITGNADSDTSPGAQGKLVLLLRNGEIRFDDIYDQTGRSVRYERLPDGHNMRKHGANTLGDAMKLILDVKPCPA